MRTCSRRPYPASQTVGWEGVFVTVIVSCCVDSASDDCCLSADENLEVCLFQFLIHFKELFKWDAPRHAR